MYCDKCGNEISRNFASSRLVRHRAEFTVEVIVAYKSTWNDGHICRECVLDVVNNGNEKDPEFLNKIRELNKK